MSLPARAALGVSLLLLVLPSVSGSVAFAWTARTEEMVVLEAMRLMPPSLYRILRRESGALLAGLREAAGTETEQGHRLVPDQKGPNAGDNLAEMTQRALKSINKQKPFSRVAHELGELAHFICDLNDPLKVTVRGEEPFARDYYAYVESNLSKYPVVFYGWEDEELSGGEVREFALQTARRSRRYYASIAAAYAPESREAKQAFDERSLPFGIGSLTYSRAVSDTAKIWLHIWKSAHGDLRGTPYMTPEPSRD